MQKTELNKDPLALFQDWYKAAEQAGQNDTDAMFLATATKDGKPSLRVVLYKGIADGGFLIFTNFGSRKSKEIEENPFGALTFFWPKVYKQIRIEGKIEKISPQESADYFSTRARDSQLGAWASQQSEVIPNREHLMARFEEYTRYFSGHEEVPCPEFWGGFRLLPNNIEFWIGSDHRLHDRFRYDKKGQEWEIVRLAP